MSIKRFIKSLKDAARGLKHIFKNEQNFRIQTMTAILALLFAAYFRLRAWEFVLVILLIMIVMAMEIMNTAIEYFADLLKPRLHHYIYVIKDIMAGAVLLTAIGSTIIGLIIFLPRFINLFK